MVASPQMQTAWDAKSRVLRVKIKLTSGVEPQTNELSWSINRHAPHTLAFEYDAWSAMPLKSVGNGQYHAEIQLGTDVDTVQLLTTHKDTINDLPLTISSPLVEVKIQ
jgi:hypothetical protein